MTIWLSMTTSRTRSTPKSYACVIKPTNDFFLPIVANYQASKTLHSRKSLFLRCFKMSTVEQQTVKTRFCILSDTHSQAPLPEGSTDRAYRQPLPTAHVLLHAGDLTMTGRVSEYQQMLNAFREADAELKIVIAGNHDITLDESFYGKIGESLFHPSKPEDVTKVREMWTGWEAKQAGIVYLEEGTRRFHLRNGAKFTVNRSTDFA